MPDLNDPANQILLFLGILLFSIFAAAAITTLPPTLSLTDTTDTTFETATYTENGYTITLNTTTAPTITHVYLLSNDGAILQQSRTHNIATTVNFHSFDPENGPFTLVAKQNTTTIATATLETNSRIF